MQSPTPEAALIADDSECLMPGAWIEQPLVLAASPRLLARPPLNDTVPELSDMASGSVVAEVLSPVVVADSLLSPVADSPKLSPLAGSLGFPPVAESVSAVVDEKYIPPVAKFAALPPVAESMSPGLESPPKKLSPQRSSILTLSGKTIALYEMALSSQYPAMLEDLEDKLQRSLYDPGDNEVDGSKVKDDDNPFSCFPKQYLTDLFCEAVDIKGVLLARHTALLVELGYLLGELTEALRTYDQAYLIMDTIDHKILHPVQQAAGLRNLNINFANLRDYRSQYKPEMGQSFIEKHSFLLASLEQCLENNQHIVAKTTVGQACRAFCLSSYEPVDNFKNVSMPLDNLGWA
ncbi:hypothetical protein HYPSUDRAFT_58632 [Hypholoma sublateritium FD-334 SS-4]|uniref:Uncharacterized protein n=1 Tax=Hypholoma sublateritium (strain FD-334 SS-4) TaxID=945553 RepID=A0A0D2N9L1_HYPSF|nr:hypothetical protein HYPSUDRAFT_58632 [Hypholoma sublateritium FD-334 SS-4]